MTGNHPLTFKEIADFVKSKDVHSVAFKRTSERQAAYEKFYAGVDKKWRSLGDYILHSKFGGPVKVDPITQKKKYSQDASTPLKKVVLTENYFPFNFDSDAQQYILWRVGDDNDVEIEDLIMSECIKSELAVSFGVGRNMNTEYVHFTHPSWLKLPSPAGEISRVYVILHAVATEQKVSPNKLKTAVTARTGREFMNIGTSENADDPQLNDSCIEGADDGDCGKYDQENDNDDDDDNGVIIGHPRFPSSPSTSSFRKYAKYALVGCGTIGALFVVRWVRTILHYREFLRDVQGVVKNLDVVGAFRVYFRYLVPFPLNIIGMQVIGRIVGKERKM